ncbi:DgyrCDS3136 [Dimorphilus gyrociliatus]|uniref:DgyrCDS3136 n=1 Tax=Dimorphilus gyrociliatus TaxID=2664684 RepID=A0A7I8VFA4_9ANNE|nr:DgyrCDS3136 [Dimorphilus gyrociliatus]
MICTILLLCLLKLAYQTQWTEETFFQDECYHVSRSPSNQIGPKTVTETICKDNGGCFFINDGCYGSKYELAGFRRTKLHVACSGSNIEEIDAIDINFCAQKCLSTERCNGFVFTFSEEDNCFLKVDCQSLEEEDGSISYLRNGYRDLTCYRDKCHDDIDDQLPLDDFQHCTDELDNYVAVGLSNEHCDQYNDCSLLPKTTRIDYASCFKEYLFEYHVDDRLKDPNVILMDGKVDTCIVLNKRGYYARHPWPTAGGEEKKANVKIYGENLSCSEISNELDGQIYVIYPAINQIEPSINGLFKGCDLNFGNSTYCAYICNCDNKHCQAIQVNLINYSQDMTVCDIKIETHV